MSVASAKSLLRSVKESGVEEVLVGLSGGKDSLVVLDLCCSMFRRVEGYCMRLLDVKCATADAEQAARRHKIPLHIVPHWATARLLKYAILRFHRADTDDIRELKLRDVEDGLREKSGIGWICSGERMADSAARRVMLQKIGGVNWDSRHAYPIWDWLDKDIYSFLRAKRIPLPERWGRAFTQGGTGFGLSAEALAHVRDRYPEDYARVVEAFPFCEVLLKRAEYQAAQVPEIHGPETSQG